MSSFRGVYTLPWSTIRLPVEDMHVVGRAHAVVEWGLARHIVLVHRQRLLDACGPGRAGSGLHIGIGPQVLPSEPLVNLKITPDACILLVHDAEGLCPRGTTLRSMTIATGGCRRARSLTKETVQCGMRGRSAYSSSATPGGNASAAWGPRAASVRMVRSCLGGMKRPGAQTALI